MNRKHIDLQDLDLQDKINKWISLDTEVKYSCNHLDDLPSPYLIEIGFIGRSNVGKSSLINALLARKNLAYTSKNPGRTQLLNFITIADGLTCLVDMPGYGYAKVGKKTRCHWKKLVFNFLCNRKNLRRTMLLIDAKHGISDKDKEAMHNFNASATPFQAILTKSDKITQASLNETISDVTKELEKSPAGHPKVIATSIRNKESISNLRTEIWNIREYIIQNNKEIILRH